MSTHEASAISSESLAAAGPDMQPEEAAPATDDIRIRIGERAGRFAEAEAASSAGTIEGYTGRVGYIQGDVVELHVSCATPTWDLQVIRVNDPWWAYEGVVLEATGLDGVVQPMPAIKPWEGAGWDVSHRFSIDPGWPSGQYIVRMTAEDGDQHVHPFVIREDDPGSTSRMAIVTMHNTVNAYNTWGGSSLYVGGPATRVSFRRPNVLFGGWSSGIYNVRLHTAIESMGYAMEYLTEDDIEKDPCLLRHYDIVVLAGHHEYSTTSFYDALEMHAERGGHLVCFSANDVYWQVRKADDRSLMVCYKYRQELDRIAHVEPCRSTYRYDLPPLNRPSERLKGLQLADHFEHFEPADYRIADPTHWVWQGMDVSEGEVFGVTMAHGEQDTLTQFSPDVDILLHGRRDQVSKTGTPPPGVDHVDTYAVFFARSPDYGFPDGLGGMVFSTGTLWGFIDNLRGPDADRVKMMTRTILDRMHATPPPPTDPCEWDPWCDSIVVPHEAPSIAAGIERVDSGGSVLVAPGTYDEVIDPMGKAIRIVGYGPSAQARLGGGLDEGPRIHVASGEGPDTVVAGFRIDGQGGSVAGGAVRVTGSSPTLRNLSLNGNEALFGGAIRVDDGAPVLENLRLSDNGALVGPAIDVRGDGPGPSLADVEICGSGDEPIAGPWADLGGNVLLAKCACVGDLDGSAVVDFVDLVMCLDSWGPCRGPDCVADLDGNRSVDSFDLILILARFGPC